MILFTYNSQRIRKSIPGLKCSIKNWDETKERISKISKYQSENFADINNAILIEFENRIIQFKKEIGANIISFSEDLLLSRIFTNKHAKINNSFYEKYEEYLNIIKPPIKAEQTVKSFITTLNKLKSFEVEHSYKITFESVNIDFYEKFRAYMLDQNEFGYNYFAKIITTIKTFMKWSEDKGYTTNIHYKKFKASEKEVDIIALDEDELLKLLFLKFIDSRLEKIRDVFCFSCFTGLRYSDLKTLKSEHIQEGYIIKDIVKTKEKIRIPISKHAQFILDKYSHLISGPLPIISSQNYNKYIKECCKLAEINKPVTINKYIGSQCKTSTLPKYELITSHVGRKTFTTLSLVLGMSETSVKQITGHKKDSNFRKYVKFTDSHKKNEMDKAWNISFKE